MSNDKSTLLTFQSGERIAVLAEGAAEEAIIDLLLDHNKLRFARTDMIEERVLRVRSADHFQQRYLNMEYEKGISVIRILDSHHEKFQLKGPYQYKVRVINAVTAPEIEMLLILSENRYKAFSNSGMKPSVFCKRVLKFHKVKSYDFVKAYFGDADKLVVAIQRYTQITKRIDGEYTLLDLLKESQV